MPGLVLWSRSKDASGANPVLDWCMSATEKDIDPFDAGVTVNKGIRFMMFCCCVACHQLTSQKHAKPMDVVGL